MSAPLTDEQLALLREACEADFHVTPATALALLDMVEDYRERWRSLVEQTLSEDVIIGPWWKVGTDG